MGRGLLVCCGVSSSVGCSELRFVSFCSWVRQLSPGGSQCSADGWTHCLFATHLSSLLCLSPFRVCLFAICSMHFDLGLPNPLLGYLLLQRVLCAVKLTQGSTCSSNIPITAITGIAHCIHCTSPSTFLTKIVRCSGLSPPLPTLVFFCFFCSSEFAAFNLLTHLSVSTIDVDSASCLLAFKLNSRTHPCQEGCCLCIGMGLSPGPLCLL